MKMKKDCSAQSSGETTAGLSDTQIGHIKATVVSLWFSFLWLYIVYGVSSQKNGLDNELAAGYAIIKLLIRYTFTSKVGW